MSPLLKMAAQLRTAGIDIKIDPKSYLNGRFARLYDPEGNPNRIVATCKTKRFHASLLSSSGLFLDDEQS